MSPALFHPWTEFLEFNINCFDTICFLVGDSNGFNNTILDKSNFFIHTPISPDPCPTVIFEAIKCKTPVITNSLGGAHEILDGGKNGLIIKNDLIEESVQKIFSYLDNKKQQKKNVEKAFNYACDNFSQEQFKRKILNSIG